MTRSPPSRRQKILVTGVSGSAGSFLAAYLHSHVNAELHGILRRPSPWPVRGLYTHAVELKNPWSTNAALKEICPDIVFHLASNANVRESFRTPVGVFENNVRATLNVLEALRRFAPEAKVVLAGTPEVLGKNPAGNASGRVDETATVRPENPYAASKLTQEALLCAYRASYGLRGVVLRCFGYINPRRLALCSSDFAYQIARAEAGGPRLLRHGWLDSIRTFCDVRDIVSAYWLAAKHGADGAIYHVGSEEPVAVSDLLARLIVRARVRLTTTCDPALLRPTDIVRQVPDTRAFRALTGWRPRRSLDSSLDWLLNEMRARVAREGNHEVA